IPASLDPSGRTAAALPARQAKFTLVGIVGRPLDARPTEFLPAPRPLDSGAHTPDRARRGPAYATRQTAVPRALARRGCRKPTAVASAACDSRIRSGYPSA